MKTILKYIGHDIDLHCRLKAAGGHPDIFAKLRVFFGSRGLWTLILHRIIHFSTNRKNLRSIKWWIARVLEIPAHYLNTVFCKSELLGDCNVEPGVYLPDGGYLTCGALGIGSGTIIHDHVTFGFAVANGRRGRPRVGKNVWIGPNCVIAGALEIGDGSTVLPGSYLTFSVPAGALVRGNPARVIREGFDNNSLRQSLALPDGVPA